MNTITENLDKKELLATFDETTSDLAQILSSLSEKELNTVPFDGSWTAGQVGEHLLKSGEGITKILSGNTRPAERPADENVKLLEDIFLDFTTKGESAKSIWPSDEAKEKEKLISILKKAMDDMRHTASSMDLSLICTDFPFPTLSELSGWEWINFVIYHTKRHIHQIKNIQKIILKS